MNDNLIKDIELFIQNHLVLDKKIQFNDWYEEEMYYVKVEDKLLKDLSKFLRKKYNKFYTVENLKKFQKLYLLFPHGLPYEISNLPWNITEILLDIFNDEKRDFYIDLCYEKNLDKKTLIYYLNHELYEKFIFITAKHYAKEKLDKVKYDTILNQVINLCERII